MPKIVIDANVVVSAAFKSGSVPENAIRLARSYDTVCLSHAVVEEIRGVLSRPKFHRAISGARIEQIIDLLGAAASWVEPTETVTECRDAKDDKYLELALAAEADFILSGDPDLLELDPWRGIRIIRPATYVAMVASRLKTIR